MVKHGGCYLRHIRHIFCRYIRCILMPAQPEVAELPIALLVFIAATVVRPVDIFPWQGCWYGGCGCSLSTESGHLKCH